MKPRLPVSQKISGSILPIALVLLNLMLPARALLAREAKPLADGGKTAIPFSAVVQIPLQAEESPAIKIGVDVNRWQKEGGTSYYRLTGWAFVKDQETRGQKVYIQFEKPDGTIVHYSTLPTERPDIGAYFKNKRYKASGFSAKIPAQNTWDIDSCTIRFLVKNKSGIYKSQMWRYGVSSRVEIELQQPEFRGMKFGALTGKRQKEDPVGYYDLSGWVFIEQQETRGQKVYVRIERPNGTVVHYSTIPIERPDIEAYFKNKLYKASGFNAKIPLKDIPDIDASNIRFVVTNQSGKYKSQVWKFGISSRAEIELRQPESLAAIFGAQTRDMEYKGADNYYNLYGWIYIYDQEPIGQKVYVQFEKPDGTVLYYSTMPCERPDIGAYFKNELYNASGFSAAIPLKELPDIDRCKIRFVVKNQSGTYLSLVWKSAIKAAPPTSAMSVFVAANWALVIITFIILFLAIWRDRSLLIKPSIMAILFFHVMCQWGSALDSGRIESTLPQPWVFFLLSQGFPLIGLIVSLLLVRESARQLWERMTVNRPSDPTRRIWIWAILAVCLAGFVAVYLNHVPFRSTGLYKIFTSPLESSLARDQSMKSLANPFLRYGYSIMMAVFAPLLAVLTTLLIMTHVRRRKWFLAIFFSICLMGVIVASSLSGARAYPAFMVLAIVFALLLRKGFPINPLYLAIGILLVLTLPTLLTLLREARTVTAKSFIQYFRVSTYQRVVVIPMEAGLQHVKYAQTHDFFGIQAIPKLAAVLGVKPLNVPNFIGRMYSGDPLTTTTTNASYVYAYYSYFGLLAFFPCVIGIWLLDLSLLIYRRLSDDMLLPCVACISLATNTFSQTEYTISLFSQGFLLLLLVSWAVDRIVQRMAPAAGKAE